MVLRPGLAAAHVAPGGGAFLRHAKGGRGRSSAASVSVRQRVANGRENQIWLRRGDLTGGFSFLGWRARCLDHTHQSHILLAGKQLLEALQGFLQGLHVFEPEHMLCHLSFVAFRLDVRTLSVCQLYNGFSIKPVKVIFLAGEQKATELHWVCRV